MKSTVDGSYIIIEGIDGAGKTSQMTFIENYFKKIGRQAYLTREPSAGLIGVFIRNELLSGKHTVGSNTIQTLFTADRMEHVKSMTSVVESGVDVISDRGYLSGIAYQPTDEEAQFSLGLHRLCMRGFKPTFTIFLDLEPEVAIERLNARLMGPGNSYMDCHKKHEIFENEERLIMARDRYHRTMDLLGKEGEVFHVIDASGSMEHVSYLIKEILDLHHGIL